MIDRGSMPVRIGEFFTLTRRDEKLLFPVASVKRMRDGLRVFGVVWLRVVRKVGKSSFGTHSVMFTLLPSRPVGCKWSQLGQVVLVTKFGQDTVCDGRRGFADRESGVSTSINEHDLVTHLF